MGTRKIASCWAVCFLQMRTAGGQADGQGRVGEELRSQPSLQNMYCTQAAKRKRFALNPRVPWLPPGCRACISPLTWLLQTRFSKGRPGLEPQLYITINLAKSHGWKECTGAYSLRDWLLSLLLAVIQKTLKSEPLGLIGQPLISCHSETLKFPALGEILASFFSGHQTTTTYTQIKSKNTLFSFL